MNNHLGNKLYIIHDVNDVNGVYDVIDVIDVIDINLCNHIKAPLYFLMYIED
jgi:hypothetical protein